MGGDSGGGPAGAFRGGMDEVRAALRSLRALHCDAGRRVAALRDAGRDPAPAAALADRLHREIRHQTGLLRSAALGGGAEKAVAEAAAPGAAGPLCVERIASAEGFDRLAPEWRELAAVAEQTGPMLTWEWMDAWLSVDRRRPLHILAVRDRAGLLVGLAPLMAYRRRAGRPVLGFMGADDFTYVEYLDILARPGARRRVLAAVAAELAGVIADGRVRSVHLARLPLDGPGAGLPELLSAAAGARLEASVEFLRQCLWEPLPADRDPDAFAERIPHPDRRRVFRRYRELLARRYPRCEFRESSAEMTVPEIMAEFRRLHVARWRLAGHDGYFADPRWEAFAMRWWDSLRRDGRLRYWRFLPDGPRGGAAAADIGVVHRGCHYALHRARDPRYAADGLGAALTCHALRGCIAEGLVRFDFLTGSEFPYKRQFVSQTATVGSVTLFAPRAGSLAGQGLRLLGRAARAAFRGSRC
jgi:CelD/BcsL family acetyltransferase involved in cellulose biosynthesis